jgi:cation transport ATPase
MSDVWLEVRGYVAAAIALVACPCHLVVTLPLLIALAAGTALGAFLRQNSALVFGVAGEVTFRGVPSPDEALAAVR